MKSTMIILDAQALFALIIIMEIFICTAAICWDIRRQVTEVRQAIADLELTLATGDQ